MTTKFINFLSNLEGASLRAATDDEIKKLKELTDKLPDIFVEIFTQAMPEDDLEYEDFDYGVAFLILCLCYSILFRRPGVGRAHKAL